MMLPEEENGLLLNAQQIQNLREAHNKMRLPKSLSSLAIHSVTTHLTRFVGAPDSPLKYLPNTLVQQLLSKIGTNIKKQKTKGMPLSILKEVLGLLVNPSVTELDCTFFEGPFFEDQTLGNYLIEHALKNCPNIREIKLNDRLNNCDQNKHLLENDDDSLQFISKSKFNVSYCVLPVTSFENRWKNLTTIICSKWGIGTIYTKDTMVFLQENFPNLEELAVSIYIPDGPTAQTMLDHFIKWKRLHTLNFLHVVADDENLYNSLIPKFFADVVGAVPSLQNFGFAYYKINVSKFIDLFGEKYPHKICLVKKLRIDNGLRRKWPKNLTVKYLTINYYWCDTEIENLSIIKCMLDLTMECRSVQQIYKVLDCIGGLVKSLTIKKMLRHSSIILERILAACPNLEHFKFVHPRSVIEDPNYSMSPAAFKNYKSFEIDDLEEYSSEVVLQQVFQRFLIGTQVCESLKLYHYDQLEALVQFALAYPESLQQLRELHFMTRIYFPSYTPDRMNEVFLKYDKCFYELLACCHKLERIFHYVDDVKDVKERKKENHYDLTIKAIDPHFIQYYGGVD